MLFKNLGSSSETHTEVAVLRVTLDTRRKYISKAKTWQDLVSSIQQRFGLSDTDELHIVDEYDTDIEEPTYTLLAPFLTELKVSVLPHDTSAIPQKATRARVSARKSTRYSLVYNKPARADDEEDNVIEDISEAEEDAGPSAVVDEYDEQEEPYEEEEVEQDLRRRNMSPLREVKPVVMRERASFQRQQQQQQEEEEEEEEEEEPAEEERPKPKIIEQYHRNAPSPFRAHRSSALSPSVPARAPTPKIKKEKPAPAPAPALATDGRFAVHISCPQIDKDAEFNIRGKHLVKKVLSGACKSFDIPVNKARLLLKLAVEEGSGVTLESYMCDPEETMKESGVTADTSLEIVFDE